MLDLRTDSSSLLLSSFFFRFWYKNTKCKIIQNTKYYEIQNISHFVKRKLEQLVLIRPYSLLAAIRLRQFVSFSCSTNSILFGNTFWKQVQHCKCDMWISTHYFMIGFYSTFYFYAVLILNSLISFSTKSAPRLFSQEIMPNQNRRLPES